MMEPNENVQKLIAKLGKQEGKKLARTANQIREWHAAMVVHLLLHDEEASLALADRTLTRLAELYLARGDKKVPDAKIAEALIAIVKDMDETWNAVHAALDGDGIVH